MLDYFKTHMTCLDFSYLVAMYKNDGNISYFKKTTRKFPKQKFLLHLDVNKTLDFYSVFCNTNGIFWHLFILNNCNDFLNTSQISFENYLALLGPKLEGGF